MSTAIVANHLAGRGRAARIGPIVRRRLDELGADYEYFETGYAGHAVELAHSAAQRHEVVAGLGGDGTVSEVLEGIWQTDCTLGVIPAGTGNDHARGLAIPLDPVGAADVLVKGRRLSMDVGVETDKIFGCLAAIGFPVTVLEYVNAAKPGSPVGKAAYLSAVWKTLKHLKAVPVTITVDDRALSADIVGVLLMNMPYGGGGLMFAPEAKPDDGLLSIVVVEDIGRWDLLWTLPKVYKGGHVGHRAVRILQGRRVQIKPAGMRKMFDGDLRSTTPMDARLVPGGVQVLVPHGPHRRSSP